ncbi:MAG: hypothetical protein AAF721_21380 [Myxococcota bacterium]
MADGMEWVRGLAGSRDAVFRAMRPLVRLGKAAVEGRQLEEWADAKEFVHVCEGQLCLQGERDLALALHRFSDAVERRQDSYEVTVAAARLFRAVEVYRAAAAGIVRA